MTTKIILPWVGLTLTVLVSVLALWKGRRDEQLAAMALLAGWAFTIALRDRSWIGPQWGALGADVAFFLVLTAITLRSDSYWPIAAAGFQLLAVVTHLARIVDPEVHAWAYASAGVIWTQLVLVAIGWGTCAAMLEERRQRRPTRPPG